MELNKKSQENCGSSTNIQADQMIVYMIDCHEDDTDERIKELNKDCDRKIEEIKNKKYAKVTLSMPYDDFSSREENLLKHGLANFLQISINERKREH
jgi:viroplasmin and RNaseH domain-containing protein